MFQIQRSNENDTCIWLQCQTMRRDAWTFYLVEEVGVIICFVVVFNAFVYTDTHSQVACQLIVDHVVIGLLNNIICGRQNCSLAKVGWILVVVVDVKVVVP